MIAGGGFALMAWNLAQDRRWSKGCNSVPLERHEIGRLDGPSSEYYRILDDAWESFERTKVAPIFWRRPRIYL